MARYRKIHVAMYADAKFTNLSRPQPSAQWLWVYLLTGPHTTIIPGVSCIGEAGLAESLGWEVEAFREVFREVYAKGMAKADWKARLVWVPNAVFYNPPESQNVIKAWSKTWPEVPECQLKVTAHTELKAFVEGLGEGWIEVFNKTFPHPSVNQEQEQEQEQENTSAAAAAGGVEKVKDARKVSNRKPPTGEHAEFIAHFSSLWRDQYGADYVWLGKDVSAASSIRKAAGSLNRAFGLVGHFLTDTDKYLAEQRHPLPMLLNRVNKYISMLGTGVAQPADPDHFVAVRPNVADLPWNRGGK
jgi:hypothetical protein